MAKVEELKALAVRSRWTTWLELFKRRAVSSLPSAGVPERVTVPPTPTLPVELTVKTLAPTTKAEVGEVVPIPRLPPEVRTMAEVPEAFTWNCWEGEDVPIPTFPMTESLAPVTRVVPLSQTAPAV